MTLDEPLTDLGPDQEIVLSARVGIPHGVPLDRTFDGDGMMTVDFQDESDASDVVLQKDGKIIVVGSTGVDSARFGSFELESSEGGGVYAVETDTDGNFGWVMQGQSPLA